MIDIKDVKNYPEVYIVYFHDGYIDGHKYSVVNMRTDYMSFYTTIGTKYFETYAEADILAKELNQKEYP